MSDQMPECTRRDLDGLLCGEAQEEWFRATSKSHPEPGTRGRLSRAAKLLVGLEHTVDRITP